MRGLKRLRDIRLRTKLLVAYLGLAVLLFTSGGIGAFIMVERAIKTNIENDLRLATRTIINMVETTALGSIRNYLRAVAERNLEIAREVYRRYERGQLSAQEARQEIRNLLLSQTIGQTGYIYCVNSQGVAMVHPNTGVEGNNWYHFDFVRRQTRLKTGYIEYRWQNPGEPTARPKALYMTYFEPYDWIISVSSYRDEFHELLPMNEIRQSVKALKFGTSGYAFVADRQGNAIIHPEMQGQNLLQMAKVDTEFFDTMLAKEFGRITYFWKNPGEPRAREKISLFGYIPELQWLVGSTAYLDELYAPLKRSRNLIIVFIAGAVGVSLVLTLFVSDTITRRLGHLTEVIEKGDRGDLTLRAAPGPDDEIGRLGRMFNAFMQRLQQSHEQLAAEVEKHRATTVSLQHERDFNAMVLSTADALVIVLDGAGRIVSFNRACAECSGFAPEELTDRFLWDVLIPEDEIDAAKAVFENLSAANVSNRHLNHWQTKDGNRRTIQWSNAAMIGADGQIQYVVGAGLDLTEHRAVERALRQSEALFEAVFNQTFQFIGILKPDGTTLSINQTALDFAGIEGDALVGLKFWEGPYWQHAPDIQARLIEAIQRAARGEFTRMELTHIRHDGVERIVDFSLKPIFDDRGEVTLLIPEGRDITERKKAEEILRLSEEKYRILVENAHDAIFIAQDGRLLYANHSTEVLTGYSTAELQRRPFTDHVHPDDRALVARRHRARMAGEAPPNFYSIRLLNRSGEVKWADLNAVRIEWEGRAAVMCFARDITSQKQIEAQLLQAQKMEAIGTLAGGIAHDFNNNLQAILGYTQLLLMDGYGSDKEQEMLVTIQHAAEHARELTQQLLTFSRKIESQLAPLDLNAELHAVAKLLKRTLPRMIEIDVDLADDLRIVAADSAQVEQVVMNLGINAGHAMPDGGRLTIATCNVTLDDDFCRRHPGAVPGDYAMLHIADTGVGMDARTCNHIFEPFFTTRETGDGTGLGLAMVYGIVKSHNGYITCESEPGQGAIFKIYFPAASMTTVSPVVKEDLDPIAGQGECVMVVDDDQTVRELGRQLLERFGYRVCEASDGEAAIRRYRRRVAEIDLIILDLNMPGMGGVACLEAIRALNPTVPVLIASGQSPAGQVKATLDQLAQGFVGKPYELKSMLRMVRATLDRAGQLG